MNHKRFIQQLLSLCGIALVFVLLNLTIYHTFTYRVLPRYSEGMQAKSIELDAYLPFVEETKIVKVEGQPKLSGKLPVIDGAAALYPLFSATVHAIYPEGCVEFDGGNFTENSALQYRNTRGAYQAIVDGDIDIAICVAPSDEQVAYAAEQGVSLVYTPIGREAFVFLVNKSNTVSSLTQEEIRGIYAGRYNNWSDFGGKDKNIAALQRNAGSGSQSAFLSFMAAGGETPVPDYDAAWGSAIGFSFRYYVEGLVAEGSVKLLAPDGIEPNVENIKNNTYPLTYDIYAVHRADEQNPNVQVVIDWLLSDAGQSMIEQTGYVGVK
ncbi:MAG: substrate-binding domain-containing protein [Clostridia bacterium]|nr:substrate-binding domain-containing protein [Clostridia bacterium]